MQIKISQLTNVYQNGKKALDNIELNIGDGMFGLLGPNGAGKSTLMKILVTLMNPSSGKVTINDLDLQKHRKQIRSMIGYLPQDFNTFPKVKSWEFLEYSAKLAKIPRNKRLSVVDDLLERVGLFDFRDRFANKLSGGMKRRLGIAQALIGNPKILIVDEPTTGLDPEERIRFRGILSEMSREERIIILSTHIVGDISSTCNDLALLVNGRVGFYGSPDKLIESARGHAFSFQVNDNELEMVKEKYVVISTIPNESGWVVEIITDKIDRKNVEPIEPNLEHAYVYFMEYLSEEAHEV